MSDFQGWLCAVIGSVGDCLDSEHLSQEYGGPIKEKTLTVTQ